MADILSQNPRTRIVSTGRYGGLDTAGVVVTIVEDARVASIVVSQDAAALTAFGTALPKRPKWIAASDVTFVGTGPGRWLAVSFGAADIEDRLRNVLAASAAVCDQSDAYILFDVAGPKAREALAKGVAIDLDAGMFCPGDAATTSVASIGTTFWQLDETPTFRFAIGRSFAPSFSRFLVMSAAEFGCSVGSSRAAPSETGRG